MPSRRTKISLQPGVLQWARERARVSRDELARKMQVKVDRVVEWEETGNHQCCPGRQARGTHTYAPWIAVPFNAAQRQSAHT